MNDWISNIFNEDLLKTNVCFASLFVLNFECLKEFVVNQVRYFYCDFEIKDGKELIKETPEYKKDVRDLHKQLDNASMKWFVDNNAISKEDYQSYQKMRQRRNDITHELLKNLSDGFSEEDAKLFGQMIVLYNKLDKWWINEIEIPTSGEELPGNYDENDVTGGQAIVLSAINEIILGDQGEKYKKLLAELEKAMLKDNHKKSAKEFNSIKY